MIGLRAILTLLYNGELEVGFRFDGKWEDAISYAIEVSVTGDQPTGMTMSNLIRKVGATCNVGSLTSNYPGMEIAEPGAMVKSNWRP